MTMLLEIISAIIAVSGTLFITFKNKWGFALWVIGNILWAIYGVITKQYFFMGQYIIFAIVSIFGFIKWMREDILKNKSGDKT